MKAGELGPFWGRKGVMFVKADSTTLGPTEYLPAIKKQGYGWVSFNVATGDWKDERRIAKAQGLDIIPWLRVRVISDLYVLQEAQKSWGSTAIIPNIEIEDTRDKALMSAALLRMSIVGKALVITDGWADPIGRWAGYRKWVGSPECFPEESPAYAKVVDCCLHAGAFFRAVVPALGSYGTKWKGRLPVLSDYVVPEGPHIVYTGDNVEDWSKW